MKVRVFLMMLIVLNATAPFAAADRDDGLTPANGFFVPEGNPEAGRTAFLRLKCMSCHQVANETDTGMSGPVGSGPLLGAQQAGYAPGWIANSIVSPSHTIALNSNGEDEDTGLSRMGDFKDMMTVRELFDMVSYIRSLEDQKANEPSSGGAL